MYNIYVLFYCLQYYYVVIVPIQRMVGTYMQEDSVDLQRSQKIEHRNIVCRYKHRHRYHIIIYYCRIDSGRLIIYL